LIWQAYQDCNGQEFASVRYGRVTAWYRVERQATEEDNMLMFLGQALHIKEEPKPIGPDSNPNGQLLGQMTLGQTSFHVELVEVNDVNDPDADSTIQEAVLPPSEHCYDELANAAGNYGPFETIKYNDRDYVMFIYPFCQ
jgi:hypothetical protein